MYQEEEKKRISDLSEKLLTPLPRDLSDYKELAEEEEIEIIDQKLWLPSKHPLLKKLFLFFKYFEITLELGGKSLKMAISFTYSFSLIVIPILLGRVSNSAIKANAVIITLLNFCVTMAIAPALVSSMYASEKLGNLHRLRRIINEQTTEINIQLLIEIEAVIDEISRIPWNTLLLCSPFILIACAILLASESLLASLGVSADIAKVAASYLRLSALLVPAGVLRVCDEQILFSFNKQTGVMILALVTFATGVGFSILVSFGPLQWGIVGVASGFVFAEWLDSACLKAFLWLDKDFKEYHFFKLFRFRFNQDRQQFKFLIQTGFPKLFTIVNELMASFSLSVIATNLGNMGAITEGFFVQFLGVTVVFSIAGGLTTIQRFKLEIGNANYVNARKVAVHGMITSMLMVLPFCIIFMADPTFFARLITTDFDDSIKKNLEEISLLGIAAALLEAAGFNMLEVLRGTGDNYRASLISVTNVWMGVIAANFLRKEWGVFGVATGYLLGFLSRAIFLFVPWYKRTQPDVLAAQHAAATQPQTAPPSSNSRWSFWSLKETFSRAFGFEATPNPTAESRLGST